MYKINEKETFCVAMATKVLGDKWTARLLVVLFNNPKHFCEIQSELNGINPRTLSLRLSKLVELGIIEKHQTNDSENRPEYKLTSMGNDLFPILEAMAAWGKKYRK